MYLYPVFLSIYFHFHLSSSPHLSHFQFHLPALSLNDSDGHFIHKRHPSAPHIVCRILHVPSSPSHHVFALLRLSSPSACHSFLPPSFSLPSCAVSLHFILSLSSPHSIPLAPSPTLPPLPLYPPSSSSTSRLCTPLDSPYYSLFGPGFPTSFPFFPPRILYAIVQVY